MILRSFVLIVALAAQALTFLIPLEVADKVERLSVLEHFQWSQEIIPIQLPCPGCKFHGLTGGNVEFSPDDDNSIQLIFSAENGQRIYINREVVFPPKDMLAAGEIKAPQIRASDSLASDFLNLEYTIEIQQPISFEVGNAVSTLLFTITAVEGSPVKVDTVKIDVLQTAQGLEIGQISTIPFAESPGAEECSTLLCRLRATLSGRLGQLLEAVRARARRIGSWMKSGCHGKKHGESTKDHSHSHGLYSHHGRKGHKGHFRFHQLAHLLRQTLRFFIIPALLGVVGGLLASALGMLVGHAIVYLWFRFHHGGHHEHIRVMETSVAEEVKDRLVEDPDLPPHYDDVDVAFLASTKD